LEIAITCAALFAVGVLSVHAQVAPSAVKGGGIPIVAGVGFSDFGIDWGPGTRMQGISAWIDFFPRGLPSKINGLGIEAEGRDLNFGRPSSIPRMRQDTALFGVIYDWNHFKNFLLNAKYLAGVGSIDFPPAPGFPNYTHDSFTVLAPGGGARYRIWRSVWVRADYEYQFWKHTFGGHDLNPQGFTIGTSYDFRSVE
jgi:opacity protein-like surface antigen